MSGDPDPRVALAQAEALEERYLSEPWFEGRDEDVRRARRKMVTTRRPRTCCGNGFGDAHEMPAGSRMLVETAIFEGRWASWALCTGCMDAWLRRIDGLEDEEQSESERACEDLGSCLCWHDGQWLGDNCEEPRAAAERKEGERA